jgi:hypothetical protein
VSFSDRFELLDLLHEGEVQTFRALDRTTGSAVEVHLSASADPLAKLESLSGPQRVPVIDRGSHEGRFYLVTTPLGLESAGAWRIPSPQKAPPGDFTRMFQLRQAPEPIAVPAARAVPAQAASQAG